MSADLSLSFEAEHDEYNVLGQNHMMSKTTPTSTGFYRAISAAEYMAGLFFQSEQISNNRHTPLGLSNLPPVPRGIFNLIAPITGPLQSGGLDSDGLSDFNQNAETLSVFTELTFGISDSTRVIVGVRCAEDDKWRVSLIGTNLTDEKTFPWMNDVPLATLGFSKTYFKHIDPPATAELRVRVNF